jgi:hypothetical protein
MRLTVLILLLSLLVWGSAVALAQTAGEFSVQSPQTGVHAPSVGGPPLGHGAAGGAIGGGMVGLGSPYAPGTISIPITSNKALDIVDKYLRKTNNEDLFADRLYEYNTHFEVELRERDTRRGAFELLIDKFNGRVTPEEGPNLLWNTKYGLNGNYFGVQPPMTLSLDDALRQVGEFIKRTSPELKVSGDVIEYYGYYEFHIVQDGKLAIEANVSGFGGQLWIENWHGSALREVLVPQP